MLTKLNLFKCKFLNKNFFFIKKLNFFRLFLVSAASSDKFKKMSTFFHENRQHFEARLIEKSLTEGTKIDKFIFTKSLLTFKIINIFFFLNQPVHSANTKSTAFFNFFYFKQINKLICSTNVKKVLLRWTLVSDLFYNLFWHEISPLVFSSPFFKNETLAVNWAVHNWEQLLWRYYHLFFNFKFNKNTETFNFFCLKMQEEGISFFLITDTTYHFKNLYFFRAFGFYTVGLVPFNMSPWIVNFPIPVADDHFLMQLFFFKYMLFIKKATLKKKYLFLKQLHFARWTDNSLKVL